MLAPAPSRAWLSRSASVETDGKRLTGQRRRAGDLGAARRPAPRGAGRAGRAGRTAALRGRRDRVLGWRRVALAARRARGGARRPARGGWPALAAAEAAPGRRRRRAGGARPPAALGDGRGAGGE